MPIPRAPRRQLLVLIAALGLLLPVAPPARALDIALSPKEAALMGAPAPLAERRPGRITFDRKVTCLTCGDSHYLSTQAAVDQRIAGEFMDELKQQLRNNGVLSRTAEKRLSLAVTLTGISHDHSKGAEAQRAAPMTNGGELVTTLTLHYELRDGEQVVLAQSIRTRGVSNSVGAMAPPEALDTALGKNLRLFLLSLKAALDPSFAATAEKEMQAITSERESTRSLLGHFMVGLAHVGVGTGKAVGGAVEVLGSDAFAAGVSGAVADNQRMRADLDRVRWAASGEGRAGHRDPVHDAAKEGVTDSSPGSMAGIATGAAPAAAKGTGVTPDAQATPAPATAGITLVAHAAAAAGEATPAEVAPPAPEQLAPRPAETETFYAYCTGITERTTKHTHFVVSSVFPIQVAVGKPWPAQQLESHWQGYLTATSSARHYLCNIFPDEARTEVSRENFFSSKTPSAVSAQQGREVTFERVDWRFRP